MTRDCVICDIEIGDLLPQRLGVPNPHPHPNATRTPNLNPNP